MESPHDHFNALTATHDEEKRVKAYMDPSDEQDDPEGVQERIYVQPREFQVYEFANKAGHLYVRAPEPTIRQMLRRYRSTYGDEWT